RGCDAGGGSFSALQVDKDFQIKGRLSQYFAPQLITREWAQPVDQPHQLFRVSDSLRNQVGLQPLPAYAPLRRDGERSPLVLNRYHDLPYTGPVSFRGGA